MVTDAKTWNDRADRADLYAVFSSRWSPAQCLDADRQQRAAIAALLPDLAGRSVLDLGCGIGRLTGWLAGEHAGPPARVVGVDYSRAMIARAARQVSGPSVGLVCASAQRLPFRERSFDAVVTTAVLQHITTDAQFGLACTEVARVLRPGGVLVCCEGVATASGEPAADCGGTSTKTVRRDLRQFEQELAPRLVLDRALPLRCVDDDYTVLRWIRVGVG